ncbi:MAG: VWA domain-containing protein [Actinomycetota bacterium]
MISGLCGFAALIRRHRGEVGAAELIDAARALTLVDLTDRRAVERALRMTLSWASDQPDAFDELFAEWFSGETLEPLEAESDQRPFDHLAEVALDAEVTEAARLHTDDAMAISDASEGADGASAEKGVSGNTPAPALPSTDDGLPVGGHGDLADAPPDDEAATSASREFDVVVALPDAPPDASLELARGALVTALEQRRESSGLGFAAKRVTTLTQPLTHAEREGLSRCATAMNRRLAGAPSWRRHPASIGAIDMRRTMRRAVTTGGLPADVRLIGRRRDAARLVVLVDVSLSVRGTSRLVLHLVHRLRSSIGSLRAFGFVDAFEPIDRPLRTDDPVRAIEGVLGSVDVQATSDPGRALRAWWSRWHHLVTDETHVVVLSDGRCNGNDPAFGTVRTVTARSASTVWVSPEPAGAWSLGRGEMAEYAACVDEALTVRSIDDLGAIPDALRRPYRLSRAAG